MDIEWNPAKARSNLKKHGISFSDVESAFSDPFGLATEDPDATGEERFLLLAADATGRAVVVVYTERGDAVRLISARPATRSERRAYEEGIRL